MSAKSSIRPEDYRVQAFQLGLQYLASGRFAAAAHLSPVSANLLHHAVEMFLKGCLAQYIGFDKLPKGRDGHNLEKLWLMYRQHVADAVLCRFYAVISELHKFEHIRYPEPLIQEGGMLSIGFPSDARNVQLSGPKLPEYQLSVEDIDALIAEIFRLGKVNSEFFRFMLVQEHASRYFSFRNLNPLLNDSTNNFHRLHPGFASNHVELWVADGTLPSATHNLLTPPTPPSARPDTPPTSRQRGKSHPQPEP